MDDFDLEVQDLRIEYLKSYYEEDFEELSEYVWDIKDGNSEAELSSLYDYVYALFQEFSITCDDVYNMADPEHYFELMLVEYELPSLLEFSADE